MKIYKIAQEADHLEELLLTMDIPSMRLNDYNWLMRNIKVRNSSHPDINEAVELIKEKVRTTRTAGSVDDHKHLSESLTKDELAEAKKKFGDDWECSIKKDEDGYYCMTHRARSKSYPSIDKIPKSSFEFIGSTG
tara:strand:+ start:61324 stop:61728 length:405 start_codon:yes stop_codon:yes gene_type:complete